MNVTWISQWANDERFVNSEGERTLNGERNSVNDEPTVNQPWTHAEWTVSECKKGKVERFMDCIYPHNVIICSLSIICKIHKPPLFNLGLYIPQKDKIFFISIN